MPPVSVNTEATIRAVFSDRLFIAALLAGPLFWASLALFHGGLNDVRWPLRMPLRFLILVAIYPLLEELAFRGFLQGSLRKTGWGSGTWAGISAANVVTSALFAAMHLWRHSTSWAGAVVVPSLVFGFFRDRYQRLWPSIFLHIFYNAGYYWLFGAR